MAQLSLDMPICRLVELGAETRRKSGELPEQRGGREVACNLREGGLSVTARPWAGQGGMKQVKSTC